MLDLEIIEKMQQNEMTEFRVYSDLAAMTKEKNAQKILLQIANEELNHAKIWQKHTKKLIKANGIKAFIYTFVAKILGITFAVKLMEKGEVSAQIAYQKIGTSYEDAVRIEKEEDAHEQKLINLINEDKLKYIGSMVLGVNDALVELTGAIAGLTFALGSTRLIGLTGLITGIAASISMAGSEYLSTKSEKLDKNPLKASVYTGFMYIVTVLLLIFPYFSTGNVFTALGSMFTIAICIIAFFSFYISVTQDVSFKRRFLEMFFISMGVSVITFSIGYAIKHIFGLDV